MQGALPNDLPAAQPAKIGVLLVNLGTPDAPDYWSVRRYLSQFLSDRRVIETHPLIWQPILHGVVLSIRPQRSGANYRRIWDRTANDSPLRVITQRQAERLQARFGDAVVVDYAMRYGRPAIAAQLALLQARGCTRILFAPLYPQYSAATTATANDAAFDALKAMRWQPAIRTLPPYFDAPEHIEALAAGVNAGLAALDFVPDVVLASYHGMPIAYFDKGDPYYDHCLTTTRLLCAALGWPEERLKTTFQSRFGRSAWLGPATDATIADLARGRKKIAILAPAFAADCIETLEEIAITGHEQYIAAGGDRDHFAYIPALNDGLLAMDMLETLARRELAGWI